MRPLIKRFLKIKVRKQGHRASVKHIDKKKRIKRGYVKHKKEVV